MSKKECEDILRKLGFSPAPTDVTTPDTSTTTPRSNFNTEVTPVRPRTQANQTDDTSTSYISLVPRLSVKREMWGRKGEPGFYCTHGRVNFDHIIILLFITRLMM